MTGTLTGGTLATGDHVVVEPDGRTAGSAPSRRSVDAVAAIGPGHRVALNLAGVDHDDARRVATRSSPPAGGGRPHGSTPP